MCGRFSQSQTRAEYLAYLAGEVGVSLDIESMVTPVFATLIFDDIIGLLKSIRRLNRATMSSAPDEPQKNYTASDEPFRYTGSSTGRSAVCIINDQYSQNQISDCLKNLLLQRLTTRTSVVASFAPRLSWPACLPVHRSQQSCFFCTVIP